MKDWKITNKFLLILMTLIMILPMNLVHATTNGLEEPQEETTLVETTDNSEELSEEIIEGLEQDESEDFDTEQEIKEEPKNENNDSIEEEDKEIPTEKDKDVNIEVNPNEDKEDDENNSKIDELEEIEIELSDDLSRDLESAVGRAYNYINPVPILGNNKISLYDSLSIQEQQTIIPKKTTEAPIYEPKKLKGLQLDKRLEELEKGKYKVTLEAFSTGSTKVVSDVIPMDIALVLDQSGSMAWGFDEDKVSNPRRLDSLIDAVDKFTKKVTNNAIDNSVNHRVAITGFSSRTFNNTELLTGVKITENNKINDRNVSYYPNNKAYNGVQYGNITPDQYKNALQEVSSQEGRQSVKNAINALTAHGGTNTLDGLDMAQKIYSNAAPTIDEKGNREERNKVLILFTDGATDSDANQVISTARSMKDSGVTIYTIGIFGGANGKMPYTPNKGSDTNSNVLMHGVSSNYPNAIADKKWVSGIFNPKYEYPYTLGTLADLEEGQSYYLSADNADKLEEAFDSISEVIGESDITLGSDTVIRDIVTPQFNMPTGDEVTVRTVPANGYNEKTNEYIWDESQAKNLDSKEIQDRSIDVNGFDFSENFVTKNARKKNEDSVEENFYGEKLVIEFIITEREGFWGGNNVTTNDSSSGVYLKDKEGNEMKEPVATFEVPSVNIPIKKDFNLIGKDNYIYLLNKKPDVDDLYELKENDKILKFSDLEEWQISYIDLDGPKLQGVNTNISNTEDTNLEDGISFTVNPKYNGNGAINEEVKGESITKKASANIYVFKPEIKHTNGSVYYGESEDDKIGELDSYRKSVKWIHPTLKVTDEDQPMDGKKPELTYDYKYSNPSDIKDGYVNTKEDIYVEVDVKIQNDPINTHTDFEFSKGKFLIEVETVELTIIKKGGTTGEPYVFEIQRNDEPYTETSITRTEKGSDSITISELPVGDYTVNENADWSWRFETEYKPENKTVNLTRENSRGEITVENKKQNYNWLNGFSKVLPNVFGQKNKEGIDNDA